MAAPDNESSSGSSSEIEPCVPPVALLFPAKNFSPKPSDFTKLKLIGKGEVGRVYLVKRNTDDAIFVMKVLPLQKMVEKQKVKTKNRKIVNIFKKGT